MTQQIKMFYLRRYFMEVYISIITKDSIFFFHLRDYSCMRRWSANCTVLAVVVLLLLHEIKILKCYTKPNNILATNAAKWHLKD